MAQQMEFDEAGSAVQKSSFHEFESGNRDSFVESYGQKISLQQADKAPSAKQRLTLAIISLWILLILTLGVTGFLTHGGQSITLPAVALLCIIVGLFGLTTILINAVFARGHAD